jgi:hypothetical protein
LVRKDINMSSAHHASGDERVLIVPATEAIADYYDYGVYICQEARSFQPVQRIAFYYDNQIHVAIPQILGAIESINLQHGTPTLSDVVPIQATKGEVYRRLDEFLTKFRASADKRATDRYLYKVLILSFADDIARTVKLVRAIPNDKQTADGTRIAFVRNQTYTNLSSLLAARTTRDLEPEK